MHEDEAGSYALGGIRLLRIVLITPMLTAGDTVACQIAVSDTGHPTASYPAGPKAGLSSAGRLASGLASFALVNAR